MIRRLGNSSAPRWYDLDLARLNAYIEFQRYSGATATELVLHDGEYDDRTARVHVVRDHWDRVLQSYRDAGMSVTIHAPLTPEFSAGRWIHDQPGLQVNYQSIIAQAIEIAEDQQGLSFVVHGASDSGHSAELNQEATVRFLQWLAESFDRADTPVVVALETRAAKDSRLTAAAVNRDETLALVRATGHPGVGICWDIAHDFENGLGVRDYDPEPGVDFLERVVHVHAHDVDEDGEPHYPLTLGRIPIETQLRALDRIRPIDSLTLEIRWRCAVRLGDPWDMLAASYARMGEVTASFHDIPGSCTDAFD